MVMMGFRPVTKLLIVAARTRSLFDERYFTRDTRQRSAGITALPAAGKNGRNQGRQEVSDEP